MEANFTDLVGETLVTITGGKGADELVFVTQSGKLFKMYHREDCCESVEIEDICGDIDDLIGSPILVAEEATSCDEHPKELRALWLLDPSKKPPHDDSFTWTFYKLDTAKGGVTIRWFGSSNGYYSESVDFELVRDGIHAV